MGAGGKCTVKSALVMKLAVHLLLILRIKKE